jgi:hypothetical protein
MRITIEQLEKIVDSANVEEKVFFDNKMLVVAYQIKVGEKDHILIGTAPVLDRANFDLEKGRGVARGKVLDQLWSLEGYKTMEACTIIGIVTFIIELWIIYKQIKFLKWLDRW